MTYEEIIDNLKVYFEDVSDFAHETNTDDTDGCPIFTEVHSEGGEGRGEHWVRVKHFPKYDIYIQIVGYYTSYNGTDFYDGWGCCSQVIPKEKTITVYE
jgi:hypothetical protein